MNKYSRRDFIALASLASAGLLLPRVLKASGYTYTHARRLLRVAHITDVHVQPQSPAPQGMANCLHAIQELPDKPDFIINTGDSIMDALAKDKSAVQAQWNVWNDILKKENSLEVKHCMGNHDIWGWSSLSVRKTDPLYGKKWAVEMFGIPHPYYTFDKDKWRFVVLDSMTHVHLGYTAKLDEEQFEWLTQTLSQTSKDKFICILSHIPILSASVFYDGKNFKNGNWKIPGSWMHEDSVRIKNLFSRFPNVKVALSGHIHLIDEVKYNGVTYYCNGAVSGAWWGGNYHEFPPAFCVVNFYEDGSTDREVYFYNWKA
ncbi:MAG: metallophosphoesterase [Chitinophagales bacterium]|nr:metallophosphoesterase [Chitinophagales bacterium]MDW8272830.1 metallophosphoesterase [Chitinophagales bacterium]